MDMCETPLKELNRPKPAYAVRVYFGSTEPEYYLYSHNREYVGYHSHYHDGPTPPGVEYISEAEAREMKLFGV